MAVRPQGTEQDAEQLALLAEPGPAATAVGRRLLEARGRIGYAAALREYVEAQEREQPRRAEG